MQILQKWSVRPKQCDNIKIQLTSKCAVIMSFISPPLILSVD